MRNSVVLRLVSAAALALMAGSVMSSPASAFVGLSDKQADEISEFVKCKTFLLKWDLTSFEADPDCGGRGPHVIESLTYGNKNGQPRHRDVDDDNDYDDCYPDYPSSTLSINVISECPTEY